MTEPAPETMGTATATSPHVSGDATEALVPAVDVPVRKLAGFEQQVQAAQAGIKAGHSPSQVKAALLATGCDPLTAETAYRTARRRLFESNRRLGARLATYAIGALCGGTLLFVPLGWTIPLVVVLLSGLLLMGVATLVWLTGLGADEN